MTKEEWIQEAKALLFDCTFCVLSNDMRDEIWKLIDKAGGYDCYTESPVSPLRWPEKT